MRFEIFIPHNGEGFDTTLTVKGTDWLAALRAALSKTGESLRKGLLCHIDQSGRLRVTDAQRGRVYYIRALDAHEISLIPTAQTAPHEAHDTLEMTPQERRELIKSLRDESETEGPFAEILDTRRTPSGAFPPVLPLPAPPDQALVDRVQKKLRWAYASERSFHEVAEALLELAGELIPSESGCVLFPGIQGRALHFAAIYGPKAEAARHLTMPIDKGLAGFCMREGVSLVVANVRQDPRFYPAISDGVGYEVRNILCVPLQFEGRVYGSMELLNNSKGRSFEFSELALLTHIGSHLAQYVALQI